MENDDDDDEKEGEVIGYERQEEESRAKRLALLVGDFTLFKGEEGKKSCTSVL